MAAGQSGESVIADLEERRYEAMLTGDVEVLAQLFHDELVYTHSSGDRDSKKTYLDKLAKQYFAYTDITRPEERIIISGDSAIVVGRMVARVLVGNQERNLDNLCLSVWTRQDGTWKLLAFQPTKV